MDSQGNKKESAGTSGVWSYGECFSCQHHDREGCFMKMPDWPYSKCERYEYEPGAGVEDQKG